jgi:hypothetical protein
MAADRGAWVAFAMSSPPGQALQRANSSTCSAPAGRHGAARQPGLDGLSVLLAGEVAAHGADRLPRGNVTIRVEGTQEHGIATIWDADVLIWAASQIVEARDAGLRPSR